MRRNTRRVIKKRNRAASIIANIALMLIIGALGLLAYRGIGLIQQIKAEVKIANLYEMATPADSFVTVRPAAEELIQQESGGEELTIMPQFTSLYNETEDTVGWLKLDDTRIDHVVMQGDNNVYYLEHDFFGNKSASAAMMLDTSCDIENIKYHYVIYGHRMKSGTMMNDILKYEDEDFFYEYPIIRFDTIYQNMNWEVFSTYLKDYNYDNTKISFSNDVEWLEYIQKLQSESIYQTYVELNPNDVVLTLYTCDYRIAGGRYGLHARLIQD